MFDIGATELLVIGIVALLVIGPRELPGVLRTLGRSLNKLRAMAGEFRTQFDDAMREAELSEARKEFDKMNEAARTATSVASFNPIETIRNEVTSAFDSARDGVQKSMLDPPPASESAPPADAPAQAGASGAPEPAPSPETPVAEPSKQGTAA